jgi:hypothetical protein
MSPAEMLTETSIEPVSQVGMGALNRLEAHAAEVSAKAMELTDSWGQAMFILDPLTVERVFTALGFSGPVSAHVYEAVRSLGYVRRDEHGGASRSEFTWHVMDAAVMTLRGATRVGASTGIDDENIEDFLETHRPLFDTVMSVMPQYTSRLMFSPEVAATVMACLGIGLSADKIYQLGATYGRQVTLDLEGRRGVSTQFIRALSLTVAASAQLS